MGFIVGNAFPHTPGPDCQSPWFETANIRQEDDESSAGIPHAAAIAAVKVPFAWCLRVCKKKRKRKKKDT